MSATATDRGIACGPTGIADGRAVGRLIAEKLHKARIHPREVV
ncbi:MAG: hypothetical protein ACK5JR_12930 [Tropicimonas sp.]